MMNMTIRRTETKEPIDEDVEVFVAYQGPMVFSFDGAYCFRLMGKGKFNGLHADGGFYRGAGAVNLVVSKGSYVVFDRYPHAKKHPTHLVPVPDIIGERSIDDQIADAIYRYKMLQDIKTEFDEPTDFNPDEPDYEDEDMVSAAYLVEFPDPDQQDEVEQDEEISSLSTRSPEPTGDLEPDTVQAEPSGDVT